MNRSAREGFAKWYLKDAFSLDRERMIEQQCHVKQRSESRNMCFRGREKACVHRATNKSEVMQWSHIWRDLKTYWE